MHVRPMIDLKNKRVLYGLGVLLIFLFVAGVFLSVPAYRHFKIWRAQQLSKTALELMDDTETLRQAWEKAYAAYNLYPFDAMVTRTLARVSASNDPSMALEFWLAAARLSGDSTEDRKGIIETALAINRLDLVGEHIIGLEEELAEDPEFLFLKARFLAQTNSFEEAIAVALQILQLEDVPEEAHYFYVQLSQTAPYLRERQEGIAYLWELAEQKDSLGLSSLQNLTRYAGISTEQTQELIRRLDQHPLSEREDRLLQLELKLKLPEIEPRKVVIEAKELFDLDTDGQLTEFGEWLNQQKLFEFTLEEVDLKSALLRQDLFLVRIDAMSVLDQWDLIGDLLIEQDIPLESYIKNLFLTRVYLEMGRTRRSNIAWDRAVLESARDPQKLWDVANYGLRIELPRARTALEKLTEIPSSMRKAYESLLILEQRTGNTEALQNLLKRMQVIYPEEPAVVNDYIYLNLLLEQNVADSLAAAGEMVERNPLLLAHLVTLSFAHLRSGDPVAALDVFDGITIKWQTAQSRWRIIIAAAFQANGYYDEVEKVLLDLDTQNLLPEEKKILEELTRN